MYSCTQSQGRATFTHTDQRRYTGVAVDKRQSGKTDDDVAQSWGEESGENMVSMVTQGKDALHALHQLCHDLTRLPLEHICNTHGAFVTIFLQECLAKRKCPL